MRVLPGIILSQTFPDARRVRGGISRAAQAALEANVCGAPIRLLHMPDLLDTGELPQIRRLVQSVDATLILCITRALNEAKVSLSSTDPENRRAAVTLAKRQLLCAEQAGAAYMDVISGARPADAPRGQGLVALLDSMAELAAFARDEVPGVQVQIEPLDHSFCKKNTLGTAEDGVWLCDQVAQRGASLGLCLDTAHMGLNGEPIEPSLRSALPCLSEFHLCNCCTQAHHPLAGDQHIAPGEPGLFGLSDYARFTRVLRESARDVMLFVEILKPDDVTEDQQLKRCCTILEAALEGCE